MELKMVKANMNNIKQNLLTETPLDIAPPNQLGNIPSETQASVFLHREIKIKSKMISNGTKISDTLLTKVHDQGETFLCSSFSTVSCARRAAIRYLEKQGHQVKHIQDDLNNDKGKYSHAKMLTVFTGCVSIRNMDGLVSNSQHSNKYYSKQSQTINNAVDRIVHRTAFGGTGWRLIGPIKSLFRKYGVDSDKIKLKSYEVLHPYWKNNYVPGSNDRTIPSIITSGCAVVVVILRNVMSYDNMEDHFPHAVLAYKVNGNKLVAKNTYSNEKIISIDLTMPDYRTFSADPQSFRSNHPSFTDDDWLMWYDGRALEFDDM